MSDNPFDPNSDKKDQEVRQDAAKELLRRINATKKLIDYTKFTFPTYIPEPAHELMASKLDAVIAGSIKRLMIFAPPQHGKSELVSVRFPTFWLGKRPNDPIILCSYGSSLAESKSRQAREIVESSDYRLLFPGFGTRKDSRSVCEWQINSGRGSMIAAGVSGPITGKGAMCFPAGTLVKTEIGDLPIEEVVKLVGKIRVLSFNHSTNSCEWRRILASSINESSELIRIRTDKKREVCCTGDHEIYICKQGYRKASSLRANQRIITTRWKNDIMSSLQGSKTQKRKRVDLQEVLFGIKKNRIRGTVPSVPKIYRRAKTQSRSGKFSNSVQDVSYKTPHNGKTWVTDTISMVKRLRCPNQFVYDIQVEGNHNFFANEILVHNCGIIDDPLKDWEEAQSSTIRDKCWEWYRTTFLTRVWEKGSIVLIQTRWHDDDLAGKLLKDQPNDWEVLRLPAISESQSERDSNNLFLGLKEGEADPLGRGAGEPLCPKRYSIEALEMFKRTVGPTGFSALYQGVPRPSEGNMFKMDWFKSADVVPYEAKRVRAWDKAASEEGDSDWTVGILMAFHDGSYYVEDMVRMRKLSGDRDKIIRKTAEQDALRYKNTVQIWVEQEPGSGGKESAQSSVRLLAGFPVQTERMTGRKEVRADPLASQARGGNVKVVKALWNRDFFNEILAFPNGSHDDIVDACSLAFNKLAGNTKFTPSLHIYKLGSKLDPSKKSKTPKIAVCDPDSLQGMIYDQECVLISILDPNCISTIPPHQLLKLLGKVDLVFADLDPTQNECNNWEEVIEPFGKKPEEIILSKEIAKKLWSFITKKRVVSPLMYVINDRGGDDRRGMSVAMAICDAMSWPREKTIYKPGEPESKFEGIAENKHVYSLVKNGRYSVL